MGVRGLLSKGLGGPAILGAIVSLAACSFGIDTAGLAGAGDGGLLADGGPGSGFPIDAGGGGTDSAAAVADGPVFDSTADTANDGSPGDTGSKDATSGSDAPPVTCFVSFVQAVPGTSKGQVMAQTASQSQSIGEQAGDLLVAIVYAGQNPGQTTPHTTAPNMTLQVSDSLGNVYYGGPLLQNQLSYQSAIQIFYAPNIKGGGNTVTAKQNLVGATPWTGLLLQEYSGIATSMVVDVSSGQDTPQNSSSISPGSMTTQSACDLVVGAFTDGHVDGQNLTTGPGWVFRSTDDWCPAGAGDNAPSGSLRNTQPNATFNLTSGADNGWVATQMAFRAANTTAPAQPTSLSFSTPQRSVSASACSQVVTVQSQVGGEATNTSLGISMSLEATGVNFFADALCTYPITTIAIGAGTSSQSFYFSSPDPGSPSILATAVGLPPTSQTETVN